MPVSFDVDVSRRIVNVVYSGVLVRDDLQTVARGLVSNRDFRPDFDQLIDAREVVMVRLTPRDLEENVRWCLFKPGSRRAGVANDDLSFGMARIFEMLRAGRMETKKIFHSMEEVRAWLEMKPLSEA